MVPSRFAFSVYFFWVRSQNANPTKPSKTTAVFMGDEIGTNTFSKVHSMNLATGVRISCVFMLRKFAPKIQLLC
jgi:hypothetical protein